MSRIRIGRLALAGALAAAACLVGFAPADARSQLPAPAAHTDSLSPASARPATPAADTSGKADKSAQRDKAGKKKKGRSKTPTTDQSSKCSAKRGKKSDCPRDPAKTPDRCPPRDRGAGPPSQPDAPTTGGPARATGTDPSAPPGGSTPAADCAGGPPPDEAAPPPGGSSPPPGGTPPSDAPPPGTPPPQTPPPHRDGDTSPPPASPPPADPGRTPPPSDPNAAPPPDPNGAPPSDPGADGPGDDGSAADDGTTGPDSDESAPDEFSAGPDDGSATDAGTAATRSGRTRHGGDSEGLSITDSGGIVGPVEIVDVDALAPSSTDLAAALPHEAPELLNPLSEPAPAGGDPLNGAPGSEVPLDAAAPALAQAGHIAARNEEPALWAAAIAFGALLLVGAGWLWIRGGPYDPA